MAPAKHKLINKELFLKRITNFFVIGLMVIFAGLIIGVVGYHYFAELPWIDSLLNASMILTGMGPVDQLETESAKVFASCYALFSGIVFLSTIGVFITPIVHRILHSFHIEEDQ